MTDETFVTELRQLKADLGPAVPMRVRWSDPTQDRLMMAGLLPLAIFPRVAFGFLRAAQTANPYLCLYPDDAQPGALPQVIVDVPDTPDVYQIEAGRHVEVHGIAQPGHAVVVVVDGHAYWPAYPARTKAHPPRL